MAVIEVENLVKEYKVNIKNEGIKGAFINLLRPQYKTITAVNNINFSIQEGETVGYIGANGAGKSTTIKMLTGILTPTSGKVLVNGIIPHKNRIKNNFQIGAIFGQRSQLWWDLPVVESYKLMQKIYEIPEDGYRKNVDTFTELLELQELLKIPARQLSLGQRMRCEIVMAFMHNPKVVYLDEPTIGLDVLAKDKIRKFITALNKETKTTVILTTHDLTDIEEVCKRIIIIDNGSIIYDGNIDEIKNKFGKYRIIEFKVNDVKNELLEILNKNSNLLSLVLNDEHNIHIKFDRQMTTASKVIELVSPQCEILDLSVQEPSVESIVKDLYRKVE